VHATIHAIQFPVSSSESDLRTLLADYRFRVCTDEVTAAKAVALRAHTDGAPIVDEYDARSWLLIAERATTGKAVGTLRISPRVLGPLPVEARVALPADLASPKSFELSRLATVALDRTARTAVTLGLCKLAFEFSLWMGSECQVASADSCDARAYLAIGFRPVERAMGDGDTDLLAHDFRRAGTGLRGNPFRDLFCELELPEILLPPRTPMMGIAPAPSTQHQPSYRIAVGA
jgi:hypothetical protein